MKRIFAVAGFFAMVLMLPALSSAQATSSAMLSVTGTVESSISMVLDSNGSGVSLTGSGSNAATLAFGNISAYNNLASNVSRTVNGTTDYTVSTPFDVKVTEANSASANYTLTAELSNADSTNTWEIDSATVTNGSAASVTATGTYGSDQSHTLYVTVPFTESTGSAIDNSISLVATAN